MESRDLHLETLPNELIARISDCFEKHDLMNLRLTSKRMSVPATKVLAKDYMFNISVLMTRRSLELLCDICAHPLFGPYIRTLHLTSGRIHPNFISELSNDISKLTLRDDRTSEEVKSAKRNLQQCLDRSRREYEIDTSPDEATNLFARAFGSLKRYGTSVTLKVCKDVWPESDDICLQLEPDGYSDRRILPSSDLNFKSTIEPCFNAMVRTSYCFTAIRINIEKSGTDPDEYNLLCVHDMSNEDISCFSGLNSISFDAHSDFPESGTSSMTRIISAAHRLKNLAYYRTDDLIKGPKIPGKHFGTCDTLLRALKTDSLSILELYYVSFSKVTLLETMNRYRDTLREVQLWDCSIRHGRWSQVVSWIKNNLLRLDYLSFGRLSIAEEEGPTDYHRKTVYEGQPAICFRKPGMELELEGFIRGKENDSW